jgi:hypothetical protein
MKKIVLLTMAAAFAMAADTPRIVFTKVFPGSDPDYVSITVDRSGAVLYKEAADEDPDKFQLEPSSTAAIFNLAEMLDHFKRPLESGLKVAKMGDKTFRWENGAEKNETKYNYSLDENAKALQDWFEHIVESQRLLIELQRVVRHDKLGANDAMLHIEVAWDQQHLVGLVQFLPLMDRVARDETYVNMARERAGRLAEVFRNAGKTSGQ